MWMNSSLSDEKPVSDEEPVPIVSQFSDRRTSFRQENQYCSCSDFWCKGTAFFFCSQIKSPSYVSFENNQMLKTVKYSFAGRKSIFFLFLNYVFSYCKQSYVPIYQNYNLLLIPFLSHLSLILLTICNLI